VNTLNNIQQAAGTVLGTVNTIYQVGSGAYNAAVDTFESVTNFAQNTASDVLTSLVYLNNTTVMNPLPQYGITPGLSNMGTLGLISQQTGIPIKIPVLQPPPAPPPPPQNIPQMLGENGPEADVSDVTPSRPPATATSQEIQAYLLQFLAVNVLGHEPRPYTWQDVLMVLQELHNIIPDGPGNGQVFSGIAAPILFGHMQQHFDPADIGILAQFADGQHHPNGNLYHILAPALAGPHQTWQEQAAGTLPGLANFGHEIVQPAVLDSVGPFGQLINTVQIALGGTPTYMSNHNPGGYAGQMNWTDLNTYSESNTMYQHLDNGNISQFIAHLQGMMQK
jgi:hypothetical protein